MPDRKAIASGEFDGRYDVLGVTDVPSPVVAARLMRIDVGKEIEAVSTVTVETKSGESVEARSWSVDVVDDGSLPGWDEPSRLIAAASEDDPRSSDSGAPDDPRDDQRTDRSSDPAENDSGRIDEDGDQRSDDDRRSDDPSATDAPGQIDTSIPSESTLDRLQATLDEVDDPARRRAILRDAFERDVSDSVRVRVRHLEAELNAFAAYASTLERFVDEYGTPRRALDEVNEELARLDAALSELDERLDTNEERIPAIANSLARLDRHQSERYRELRERVDGHSERVTEAADRIDDLEATVGKLVALQSEQWSRLTQRIEERDRELRRIVAGWITDAELELFELEQRVEANESWRRGVTEASVQEPPTR